MGDINKQGHTQHNIMLVVELQLHPFDASSQKNNKNKVPFIYLNAEVQGNNIYITLSAISSMHAPISSKFTNKPHFSGSHLVERIICFLIQ